MPMVSPDICFSGLLSFSIIEGRPERKFQPSLQFCSTSAFPFHQPAAEPFYGHIDDPEVLPIGNPNARRYIPTAILACPEDQDEKPTSHVSGGSQEFQLPSVPSPSALSPPGIVG